MVSTGVSNGSPEGAKQRATARKRAREGPSRTFPFVAGEGRGLGWPEVGGKPGRAGQLGRKRAPTTPPYWKTGLTRRATGGWGSDGRGWIGPVSPRRQPSGHFRIEAGQPLGRGRPLRTRLQVEVPSSRHGGRAPILAIIHTVEVPQLSQRRRARGDRRTPPAAGTKGFEARRPTCPPRGAGRPTFPGARRY